MRRRIARTVASITHNESKNIAERHKGTITYRCEQRPGKTGTTFKLSLPISHTLRKVDASPSFSRPYRDDSAAISKAASPSCRAAADAHGGNGCGKCSVRGWLRKPEPVQSRVQPFLWPATNARYQSIARQQSRGYHCRLAAELLGRSNVGLFSAVANRALRELRKRSSRNTGRAQPVDATLAWSLLAGVLRKFPKSRAV